MIYATRNKYVIAKKSVENKTFNKKNENKYIKISLIMCENSKDLKIMIKNKSELMYTQVSIDQDGKKTTKQNKYKFNFLTIVSLRQ